MKRYMLFVAAVLLFAFNYHGGTASTKAVAITEVPVSRTTSSVPTLIVSQDSANAATTIKTNNKAAVPTVYALRATKRVLPKAVILEDAPGHSIPLYKEYAERWYSSTNKNMKDKANNRLNYLSYRERWQHHILT